MNLEEYYKFVERANGPVPENLRRGQYTFSSLWNIDCKLCRKVSKKIDPFYKDELVADFLTELKRFVTIDEIDQDNIDQILSFYEVKISWEDEFTSDEVTYTKIPEMAHWCMSWKHGVLAMSFVDEKYAKLEAGVVAHLFSNGIDVALSLELARCYASVIQNRERIP
jgi:hypothetical protein